MNPGLLQTIAAVRASLRPSRNPDPSVIGIDWRSYETVRVALAYIPNRTATLPYVLGVSAGVALVVHNSIPTQPFSDESAEAVEYSDGIQDAVCIQRAAGTLDPNYSEIFNSIFGGA